MATLRLLRGCVTLGLQKLHEILKTAEMDLLCGVKGRTTLDKH
jgi:hypothetical protein